MEPWLAISYNLTPFSTVFHIKLDLKAMLVCKADDIISQRVCVTPFCLGDFTVGCSLARLGGINPEEFVQGPDTVKEFVESHKSPLTKMCWWAPGISHFP
jgi:hypothetical protein